MRRNVLLLVLMLGTSGTALGQDPNDVKNRPSPPRPNRIKHLQEQAARFIQATRQFSNWDEHYEYIMEAAEKVYERNNWSSESDLFSLEMAREVGRIPPWKMQERLNRAMDMIGDRYLLNEQQKQLLLNIVVRESLGVFARHADRIMEYSLGFVETRASGQPFTPEQISHWMELAQPVFEDALDRTEQASKIFMDQLDPEQRQLVQQDLDATLGRVADMDKLAQRWRNGEWDPSDWGLEEDPIQTGTWTPGEADGGRAAGAARAPGGDRPRGAAARRPRDAAARHAEAEQGQPPPDEPAVELPDASRPRGGTARGARDSEVGAGDETGAGEKPAPRRDGKAAASGPSDDWAAYVRSFIAKYQLNEEQRQRAWLLYEDARARREVFSKRAERIAREIAQKSGEGSEAAAGALAEHAQQARKDEGRLFEQLKQRLERIPTRSQRREADAASRPKSSDRKAASRGSAKDDEAP
ncbi:MAG: hypothetical protein HRF50_06905 [Phycisphaerae bacterium]|jgi:hypothetical protein